VFTRPATIRPNLSSPTLLARALALSTLLLAPVLAFSTERVAKDMAAILSQGPRVAGTPPLTAAGDYIAAELRQVGYRVDFHSFSYVRSRDTGSSLEAAGQTIAANGLNGSPGARLEGPLLAVPGAGRAEDYAGLDARGKIVLVRRGSIPFAEKARQAAAQGAIGMVVVNNAPGNIRGTYGGTGPIPGVTVGQAEGEALFGQTGLTVLLTVGTITEEVSGRNLIAKLGDAPQVIVGGHYDSVPGAPGANDNGSGSVTILELARTVAQEPWARGIWFMWFDGEEDGLWGSRKFVEDNPQIMQGLKAMLNLDMVGVKVFDTLAVAGSPNLIEETLKVEVNIRSSFDGSGASDHASFQAAGVPVLFFHRGLDVNYHRPGDSLFDPALLADTARVVRGLLERLLVPTGVTAQ
jgi:hypothetical protein